MNGAEFETIDGEIFVIRFSTHYDCDEFLAKYWFIEKILKDEGYDIVFRSLSESAKTEVK